jgi:hypothetical protein
LKGEFLSLLERDKEFRYAVAGLLGLEEILRRLDRHEEELIKLREEMKELRVDMNRLREDMNKLREDMGGIREDMLMGFKRHDEELIKLREDMLMGFKRHDEELIKLREDMNRGFMLLERRISALGARWGLMSEEAFREGIKGLVEGELGLKIERWSRYDAKGSVSGYPSQVEIDMALHDEKIVLVEVKSYVRASDVYLFKKKAEFYEETEGKKPSRLVIVTPYAEEGALEAAKHLSIEIYTKI